MQTDNNKMVGFTMRMEKSLKDEFQKICKVRDETPSQVVRRYVRKYLMKNGVQDK